MSNPLIIAHRGVATHAPENTISAFAAAIAQQADMIELDVRKTKDQRLVVHHDAYLSDHLIRGLTYGEILSLNPQIPTLESVLKETAGKISLNIELKEIGDEKSVLENMLNYFSINDFVISSFYSAAIQTIQQQDSRIRTGQLFSANDARWLAECVLTQPPFLTESNRKASRAYGDIWVLHWQLLQSDIWQQIKLQQREIWVWTVNEPVLLRSLLQDGHIHGIITDRVEVARALKG
ncbi:MAG: glycerophosphodiester phosphodiesterase [Scytolyngbya sp. HA4215-MV1]|jgi:glycerophosphoryl diester phosphodiesterase|nr:glycerophosphodiester phosphodiesterase [Scytolyngbya sp. HA4215-MV1]